MSATAFGLPKALLAAGFAVALPVLDVSLNVIGLRRTLALLAPIARPPLAPPRPNHDGFEHVVQAIDRATRCYRRSGRCLRRSTLLWLWLTRNGVPAMITVGAKRLGDHLAGHAWVEVAGEVAAEPADGPTAFVVFARYGGSADPWHINPHDRSTGTTTGRPRPTVVEEEGKGAKWETSSKRNASRTTAPC